MVTKASKLCNQLVRRTIGLMERTYRTLLGGDFAKAEWMELWEQPGSNVGMERREIEWESYFNEHLEVAAELPAQMHSMNHTQQAKHDIKYLSSYLVRCRKCSAHRSVSVPPDAWLMMLAPRWRVKVDAVGVGYKDDKEAKAELNPNAPVFVPGGAWGCRSWGGLLRFQVSYCRSRLPHWMSFPLSC